MMTGIAIGCKATWIDIPAHDGVADLPHEEGQLIGCQFAHGEIKVFKLLIPHPEVKPYD